MQQQQSTAFGVYSVYVVESALVSSSFECARIDNVGLGLLLLVCIGKREKKKEKGKLRLTH